MRPRCIAMPFGRLDAGDELDHRRSSRSASFRAAPCGLRRRRRSGGRRRPALLLLAAAGRHVERAWWIPGRTWGVGGSVYERRRVTRAPPSKAGCAQPARRPVISAWSSHPPAPGSRSERRPVHPRGSRGPATRARRGAGGGRGLRNSDRRGASRARRAARTPSRKRPGSGTIGHRFARPGMARRRATSIDGDDEVLPGLRVIWSGAHTNGHQSVVAETADGPVCIAGDIVSLAANAVAPGPMTPDAESRGGLSCRLRGWGRSPPTSRPCAVTGGTSLAHPSAERGRGRPSSGHAGRKTATWSGLGPSRDRAAAASPLFRRRPAVCRSSGWDFGLEAVDCDGNRVVPVGDVCSTEVRERFEGEGLRSTSASRGVRPSSRAGVDGYTAPDRRPRRAVTATVLARRGAPSRWSDGRRAT